MESNSEIRLRANAVNKVNDTGAQALLLLIGLFSAAVSGGGAAGYAAEGVVEGAQGGKAA